MKVGEGPGSRNTQSVVTNGRTPVSSPSFLLHLGHGDLDVRSAILLRIAVGFIRYYVAFLPQRTWKQQIGELL